MKTTRRARKRLARQASAAEDRGQIVDLYRDLVAHPDSGPVLSGGDLDADWQRAAASGEEAVGGSVPTPDQDVVDEIGRALGVEQATDAPVTSSEEMLRFRDRHYWHLERQASKENDG